MTFCPPNLLGEKLLGLHGPCLLDDNFSLRAQAEQEVNTSEKPPSPVKLLQCAAAP